MLQWNARFAVVLASLTVIASWLGFGWTGWQW
jgi:hypothetical protein